MIKKSDFKQTNLNSKIYYATFEEMKRKVVIKDVYTEDGDYILEEDEFFPVPKVFKQAKLKKGDLISFRAYGEFPQIYGLKRPSNLKVIKRA